MYDGEVVMDLDEYYLNVAELYLNYKLGSRYKKANQFVHQISVYEHEIPLLNDYVKFCSNYGKIYKVRFELKKGLRNLVYLNWEGKNLYKKNLLFDHENPIELNSKNLTKLFLEKDLNYSTIEIKNQDENLKKEAEYLNKTKNKVDCFEKLVKGIQSPFKLILVFDKEIVVIKKKMDDLSFYKYTIIKETDLSCQSHNFLMSYPLEKEEYRCMEFKGKKIPLFEPFMEEFVRLEQEKNKKIDNKNQVYSVCEFCVFKLRKVTKGCDFCKPKKTNK